jgi:hypothetical protein
MGETVIGIEVELDMRVIDDNKALQHYQHTQIEDFHPQEIRYWRMLLFAPLTAVLTCHRDA